MRNIALKLMYNGTAYHGWQVQKQSLIHISAPTRQAEI